MTTIVQPEVHELKMLIRKPLQVLLEQPAHIYANSLDEDAYLLLENEHGQRGIFHMDGEDGAELIKLRKKKKLSPTDAANLSALEEEFTIALECVTWRNAYEWLTFVEDRSWGLAHQWYAFADNGQFFVETILADYHLH